LCKWLSRGNKQGFPARNLEQAVLSAFDIPPADNECPAAPFSLLGASGEAPTGYCLYATPVHLRTDSSGLILFDASTLSISPEENQALAATAAELLAEDGWRLDARYPPHWYLSGGQPQRLFTTPLSRVQGRNVGGFLPVGEDASAWLRRINEIQMLMHAHPVNQRRAARGLPVVNSVWIWGGGVLPDHSGSHFSRVVADDALTRGLGRWSESPCEVVPDDAPLAINRMHRGERMLVVLERCGQPANYGKFEQWNQAVEWCERYWFAPLLDALARGRVQSLQLLALNGIRYTLRARDLWRFWRASRPFAEVLKADSP
jgi:hypothetical protein